MAGSIKDMSQLLANFLGSSKKIKSERITRLTAVGDNYGSLMLKVDITVYDENTAEEEVIYLVAKKIPAAEVFQEIFNIQVTFKKEVAFYDKIITTLQEFQKEMGCSTVIDFFPKFCGARFNLDNSDVVDENAVLALENLVSSGFSTIDRLDGFDLESSKAVLRDLAEFHSLSLALKLKKRDFFDQNIKKYCQDYNFDHESEQIFRECARDILLQNEDCAEVAGKINYLGEIPRPAAREPFATLIHFDLWINNTMQKRVDEKIVNKFVDFQLYTYGSPAADLFFFLWSSVQQKVIRDHLDYLIKHYHDIFIQNLSDLKCDTAPFGFDNLLEEIKLESDFEFGHALIFFLFVVKKPKELGETNEIPRTKDELKRNISSEVKKKAWYMTKECRKRGWLGNI